MTIKCPSCGSENPEHVFYCGTCANALRELSVPTRGDDRAVRTPRTIADYQPRVSRTLSHPIALTLAVVVVAISAFGLLYLLLGKAFSDHGPLLALYLYLVLGGYYVVVSTYAIWTRKSKRWRATHRANMPPPERRPILAEVECLTVAQIAGVSLLFCALSIVPISLRSQLDTLLEMVYAWIGPCAVLVGYAVAHAVSRPHLGIEENGIFLRANRDLNEAFLPWSMISSVRFGRKLVRISIKEAPAYARHWHLLLLGNASKLRQELEHLGRVSMT